MLEQMILGKVMLYYLDKLKLSSFRNPHYARYGSIEPTAEQRREVLDRVSKSVLPYSPAIINSSYR